MVKNLIIILIGVFIISTSNSQNIKSLEELNIDEYYTEEEAKSNIFSDLDIEYDTISNEVINNDFSNIDDLIWLAEIAEDNKVILVGETHYSRFIGNIASRIFFTINKYDYYPIILIEKPYSITEYINYYTSIKNDDESKNYFNQELIQFVDTEEEAAFYEQIRIWNKINKNKPLKIGATDLEFNIQRTINQIIKPFLGELNNVNADEIDSIVKQGLSLSDDFFHNITMIIEKEENRSITGEYPFINNVFIGNIVKNLKATKQAYANDFNVNRHNTIKRNLIDSSFFGLYLQKSKIMLYGGGNHMKTKSFSTDSTDALSEGIFLTNDYKATKGKTYSVMLNGMAAFLLDKMAERDLNNCIRQGSQYNRIIERLVKAYGNELILANKPYFLFNQRNDFEKLIAHLSFKGNNNSIIISTKSKVEILDKISKFTIGKRENYKEIIEGKEMFDKYIYVPFSPIVTARYK